MILATLLEPDLGALRKAISALDPVADAFEVRLDALRSPAAPESIRGLTRKPLVATLRRAADGGTHTGPEAARLAQLRACTAAGFEFVDVEGATKIDVPEDRLIRSVHERTRAPGREEIEAQGRTLSARGAVFKFASPAESFEATIALLGASETLRRDGRRFAVMGLGEFPRPLAHLWGSHLVYGGGRTSAPGQPPLVEIRGTLAHWGDPVPAPERYLVVGDPIEHSLSPRLHNAGFRDLGLDACYGALRVRNEDELRHVFEAAVQLGLRGLSVTTPLKDAAFQLVDRRSPEAERCRAVNCVRFQNGASEGTNTDGPGARRIVERLAKRGAKVLVVGGGGAARALLAELSPKQTTVALRDPRSLVPIAGKDFPVIPLREAAGRLLAFDLLVNATRVEDPLPLGDYRGALFDYHYGPEPTVWESVAARHGSPIAGGRDLLLEQGLLAFEYWTGAKAPVDALHQALEAVA